MTTESILLKQGAELLLICLPELINKIACTQCIFLINDGTSLSSLLYL